MSETGQELLEKAIRNDFIFETIRKISPEEYVSEKRRAEKDRRGSFHKAVNALSVEARAGDKEAEIALAMAIRFFDDLTEICPVLDGTVEPRAARHDSVRTFDAAVEEEVVHRLVEKAEKLYQEAISQKPIPYQFRNQWLERAIRITLELSDLSNETKWEFEGVKPKAPVKAGKG